MRMNVSNCPLMLVQHHELHPKTRPSAPASGTGASCHQQLPGAEAKAGRWLEEEDSAWKNISTVDFLNDMP